MDFERGQDPKYTLKIGKRPLIDKWFEEWAPHVDYVVSSDLSIKVKGSLYLSSDTKKISLPDNLTITRDLYLENSRMISMPDSLEVEGRIYKDFHI